MPIESRKALGENGVWFADTFQQALTHSLEAMTMEQPKIQWTVVAAPDAPAEIGGGWSWWEQQLSASPETVLWVGLPEGDWQAIGKLALAAAGIDDATPDDCLGTWKEIASQSLSTTASAFGKRIGKEVTCGAGKDATSPSSLEACLELALELAGASHTVRFGWSRAIQLFLDPPPAPSPEPAPRAAAAAGSAAPVKNAIPAVENSRTLGLLLEVELPVSVSFGRAQLPLKDVLKLNSGSIVELNRAIAEPVEVIVNNCVIARGEVVVVEGNYGVRIKQIISKEERLRTLY
ncbi:MAG: flagellar motor switch protein FliN [Bryobacterales bacterium]|nr:flagellar motor switch protein FliN [Bryobacterales bacterium]